VDSVVTVAGARYAKGWLHGQLFGTRYRDAWASAIQVPVLDLATFAGGLEPIKRGGGEQTRSLRFEGADGRQYTFRSVDKDPIPAMDPSLRTELTEELFQDQISAGHPTAPLAAAPILRAVGVLHGQPRLFFMPDDPTLGEYRDEFANMLGTLEERPRGVGEGGPGFARAIRIVDTDDLLEELDRDSRVGVSAPDFLAARLTDIFLGDWDRHRDQWQWALMADSVGSRWLPLPRDRDQAFSRYDGFVLRLIRARKPQLVVFGPKYSPLIGATWNGRDLDRLLLIELERPVWDSVATALAGRITDRVIDEAVAALPVSHRQLTGEDLTHALRARRDALPEVATRYYEFLAGEVDVTGSEEAEVALVDRLDADQLIVELRQVGATRPYYHRRFRAGETHEVRVYLQGGSDSAIVAGSGRVPVAVKIVGGAGDDRFLELSGRELIGFYDDDGNDESIGKEIDRRPYQALTDSVEGETRIPRRDWGRSAGFFPTVSFHSNRGLLVGVGHRTTQYRFRRVPYATRVEYLAEVGFALGSGRVQFRWHHPLENSSTIIRVRAMASGVEIARWFGFGNETPHDLSRPSSYYWLNPYQLSLEGTIDRSLGRNLTINLGVITKHTITNVNREDIADRFIAADRPFGTGGLSQLGGRAGLRVETRADNAPLTTALRAEIDVTGYPALLDLPRPLASVGGRVAVSARAPIPLSPTVALQLGAQRVFGTSGLIPFYEAAFLGSWSTVRGYRTHRFAGDAAVYGSAELRLDLFSLPHSGAGAAGHFRLLRSRAGVPRR
jgi:hypothetical protein